MSTMQCPKCGKQYRLNEQVAGKQIRCQACQEIFRAPEMAYDASLIADALPDKPVRSSDEIDYEIFGNEMQFAEVTLDPTEMVLAEAGSMMFMTSGIKMDTVFGDPSQQNQGFWSKVASAGKRMLTGESLFMTTFTNIG